VVELTGDEKDALAANCPDCWARMDQQCRVMRGSPPQVTNRIRRHPHPNRIGRASRRGVLGGVGRALLEQNRKIDG